MYLSICAFCDSNDAHGLNSQNMNPQKNRPPCKLGTILKMLSNDMVPIFASTLYWEVIILVIDK
jgi:hypothetical protein